MTARAHAIAAGQAPAGKLLTQHELTRPAGAVADSMSVAVWTLISRCSGVLRGVTIAAVLGATYFANTYQFTNSLPNLVFYGLLAGSLFSSLLVPALVKSVDRGDADAAARMAGGLLGVALVGTLAVVPVAALATPWLLHLGSDAAANPAAAADQAHLGTILVLLLLPQVPLYALIGTCTAVMNAHRRFALAAAAPALENLGTIAVLGIVFFSYASSAEHGQVPLSLLLLLGLGTTAAVAAHASVQWWGARRVGVGLRPRAGWRDPEVRIVIRRALPAAGQAALVALQLLALLVVADKIAGGVVAFQLALNFYFLPIAVGATPVALSLVPRLARLTGPGQAEQFRDTYLRGLAFASFFIIPAAIGYAVLARPLAAAIAYGHFGTTAAEELVAAALSGLAAGIIGETLFMVATYACYARHDTSRPLRGMLIQAGVCAAGIAVSLPAHGPLLLAGLGLSLAVGSLSGAAYLLIRLRRELPPGGQPTVAPLLRALAAAAVMAAVAWGAARVVVLIFDDQAGRVLALLVAALAGAATYLAVQGIARAPELTWVTDALGGRGMGAASLWQTAQRWPVRRRAADQAGGGSERPPGRPGRLPLPGNLDWAMQRRRLIEVILLLCSMALVVLAAFSVKYAIIALVVVGLSAVILVRPQLAAYLLILLTPLIVGVNAGAVIPLLRPNEALIVWFGVLVAIRWIAGLRSGDRPWPRLGKVDIGLIALGLTSSVLPLLMMVARQRQITSDDLLYSIVIWKLIAEYVIVRSSISTSEQQMKCLWLSLIAAAVVCVIAILQSLNLFGVPSLLATYYAPLGQTSAVSIGRGSSLLALPAAVADLAILNFAIATGMISRMRAQRIILVPLAILFALGVVAAAEFSTAIGLLAALVVLVVLTRSWRMLGYAIPIGLVGGALLWPVIQLRLAGFHTASGIPVSWTTRLTNLRTYFWPQLFSDNNWILGVHPDSRVVAPNQEFGYVWIESGYIWLLWAGGLPLLGSYLYFAVAAIRKGWSLAKHSGPAGIVGMAIAAAVASQVLLMTLDPHLTYRGSGDALFLTLALARVLPSARQRQSDADGAQRDGQRRGATAALDATPPAREEVPA